MTAIALFFTANASAQFANLSPEQAASLNEAAGRNVAKYNPDHADLGVAAGLGLQGKDPVSFYSEAGPVDGNPAIQVRHQGVIYNFSSEENKEIFLANPNKYEPTYGGFCAWAMVTGSPVPIDVRYYTFDLDADGNRVRINFFVNAAAMGNFHGLNRRRDGVFTSLEILEFMENSSHKFHQRVVERGEAFQVDADQTWVKDEFGAEEPRFSNGLN